MSRMASTLREGPNLPSARKACNAWMSGLNRTLGSFAAAVALAAAGAVVAVVVVVVVAWSVAVVVEALTASAVAFFVAAVVIFGASSSFTVAKVFSPALAFKGCVVLVAVGAGAGLLGNEDGAAGVCPAAIAVTQLDADTGFADVPSTFTISFSGFHFDAPGAG